MRIKALFNTYRDRCTEFYTQIKDGYVTAVISRLGVGFTLRCFDGADMAEPESFFSFFGGEVFCSAGDAEGFCRFEKKLYKLFRLCEKPTERESFGKTTPISELYGLLWQGSDKDIALPPYEEWYPDFCIRVNHGVRIIV